MPLQVELVEVRLDDGFKVTCWKQQGAEIPLAAVDPSVSSETVQKAQAAAANDQNGSDGPNFRRCRKLFPTIEDGEGAADQQVLKSFTVPSTPPPLHWLLQDILAVVVPSEDDEDSSEQLLPPGSLVVSPTGVGAVAGMSVLVKAACDACCLLDCMCDSGLEDARVLVADEYPFECCIAGCGENHNLSWVSAGGGACLHLACPSHIEESHTNSGICLKCADGANPNARPDSDKFYWTLGGKTGDGKTTLINAVLGRGPEIPPPASRAGAVGATQAPQLFTPVSGQCPRNVGIVDRPGHSDGASSYLKLQRLLQEGKEHRRLAQLGWRYAGHLHLITESERNSEWTNNVAHEDIRCIAGVLGHPIEEIFARTHIVRNVRRLQVKEVDHVIEDDRIFRKPNCHSCCASLCVLPCTCSHPMFTVVRIDQDDNGDDIFVCRPWERCPLNDDATDDIEISFDDAIPVQDFVEHHEIFLGASGTGRGTFSNNLGITKITTLDTNTQMNSRTAGWPSGSFKDLLLDHFIRTHVGMPVPGHPPLVPQGRWFATTKNIKKAASERRKLLHDRMTGKPFLVDGKKTKLVVKCYSELMFNYASDVFKNEIVHAVRAYIKECNRVMAELPNYGEPDHVLGEGPRDAPSIFSRKCTSKVYSFDPDNKNEAQHRFSDLNAHRVFPGYSNVLMRYALMLCGCDADLCFELPHDVGALLDDKQLWRPEDIADEPRIERVDRPDDREDSTYTTEAAEFTQVWEFANFIKTFTSAEQSPMTYRRCPLKLPLGQTMINDSATTWEEQVKRDLPRGKCNLLAANKFLATIVDNIRRTNALPRCTLAIGEPGVGKTSVFHACRQAMGLHHMLTPPLERLLGTGYEGDRAAATVAFLTMGNAFCGCGCVFADECDYTLNDIEENKENVIPFVARLDGAGYQNPGLMVYLACNEWTKMAEKLLDRFKDNILFIGVSRISELIQSYRDYEVAHSGAMHPILYESGAPSATVGGVMAHSCGSRRAFNLDAGATLQNVHKKNTFPTRDSGGTNIAALALMAEGTDRGKVLADVLKRCRNNNDLSGRIVVLEVGDFCVVEIERKTRKTLCCLVRSMLDVYWALLEFARYFDGYCTRYLQREEGSDSAEAAQRLGLAKKLYLDNYDVATLMIPLDYAQFGAADRQTGGSGSQAKPTDAPVLNDLLRKVFLRSPSGKTQLCVLHCNSIPQFEACTSFHEAPHFKISADASQLLASLAFEEGYKKHTCPHCNTLFGKNDPNQTCIHQRREDDQELMALITHERFKTTQVIRHMTFDAAKRLIESGSLPDDERILSVRPPCGEGCQLFPSRINDKCPRGIPQPHEWEWDREDPLSHVLLTAVSLKPLKCVHCRGRWNDTKEEKTCENNKKRFVAGHEDFDGLCDVYLEKTESINAYLEVPAREADVVVKTLRKGNVEHLLCAHNCRSRPGAEKCPNARHEPPAHYTSLVAQHLEETFGDDYPF